VVSIRALENGARILIELKPCGSEGAPRERLQIFAKDMPPYLKKGEISPETVEELQRLDAFCRAMDTGLRLLSFGSCSARRLVQKLMARHIPREVATAVTEEIARMGFLHEEEGALREAEKGLMKLWGNRRISMELSAKGYAKEAVHAAMESLEDDDETARCVRLVQKRYRGELAEEPPRRLLAALYRYGYAEETAKRAVAILKNNEDCLI